MKNTLIFSLVLLSAINTSYAENKPSPIAKAAIQGFSEGMGLGASLLHELVGGDKKPSNFTYEPKKTNKIWIAGKPLKECMSGTKKIDNNVVNCHYGYYSNE